MFADEARAVLEYSLSSGKHSSLLLETFLPGPDHLSCTQKEKMKNTLHAREPGRGLIDKRSKREKAASCLERPWGCQVAARRRES